MIGRLLGLIVGLAIAAVGYGLWKPVEFARYIPPKYLDLSHFPLGPYEQYKAIVAGMTVALGLVVALAALQRQSRPKRTRPAPTLFMSSEGEHTSSADPFSIAPVAAAHGDDHGHAPAHDDHGHDAHASDDHSHDVHGHADHGHDDHAKAHDDHGHDAHDAHDAHDDHGHGHGGHAPAHH